MSVTSSLLRRLRHHAWSERAVLGGAALCCLSMWVALRVFSLPTLVRWTGRVGSRSEEVDEKKVEHIVWAVRTTGHHLFPDRPCLPTALTARALLGVLGASTDLEIGVQREDGTLQAHAWLERRGDVLIGGRDARSDYQVLTDP